MDEAKNAVEIAVLREQINGLREQHKAHAQATASQFDRLGEKVDELIAIMNKGKGAYAVSIMVAGIISAALVKAVTYIVGR